MTTFYLIRHAERSGDQTLLAGRIEGLHLTTVGREQARRLARHLATEPIHHVFSSPVDRAQETAAFVAEPHHVTVALSTAITEIDSGAWTGSTFGQLDQVQTWRRFNRFRGTTRIPNGETMVEVQARFVGEMLRLRDTFPDDTIALVSHADPIKIALAHFLGVSIDLYDRFEIGLASVSVMTLGDGDAKVLRLNEQVHVSA